MRVTSLKDAGPADCARAVSGVSTGGEGRPAPRLGGVLPEPVATGESASSRLGTATWWRPPSLQSWTPMRAEQAAGLMAGVLRRTHLSAPDDLAGVVDDEAREVGARQVDISLIDYEAASLRPLPRSADDVREV